MKKITPALYILLSVLPFQMVRSQCPATVPTFSVNLPQTPADADFVLFDAVRNAAGNMAAIGMKRKAGGLDWEAYFVLLDGDGLLIGEPQEISPSGGLPPDWMFYESKAAFITEAFDAGGLPAGYFIAVNTADATDKDIWVARLDPLGCVVWGKRLGAAADGFDELARGVHRTPTNEYAVLSARNPGISGTMAIHTVDFSGTACTTYDFPGNFIPASMTPLTAGAFGTAIWAVCGTEKAGFGDMPAVALLDANFEETNGFGDAFDPDVADLGKPVAYDLVQSGLNLFVVGYTPSVSGKGWLMRLSYSPVGMSELAYDFSKNIDWPDDPLFLFQYDVAWDIEAKNDTIAVGGWSYFSDPSIPYRPWALTFSDAGTLLKSKKFTEPASPYGLLHKIVNIPDKGFFLAGQKWDSPGTFGGTQAFAGRCDKNLVIGDCLCQQDQPFLAPDQMGGLVTNIDFQGGFGAPCTESPVGATCTDDDDTRKVCFGLPDPICAVSITLDALDPCTGEATISAEATGMSGLVSYQWELYNGQMPVGQTINLTFLNSGSFGVTVTASDGSCTAIASENILVELDNLPPDLICPGDQTVTGFLDPGGNCFAEVFGLTPQVSDNCPPVAVSYDLSGASSGSGADDASGTVFNEGVTTVTYTAVDASGLSSACSLTVEVICLDIDEFSKVYGDAGHNSPTKIKAFGNYVYVAGVTEEGGLTYGTFSKFDPVAGDLVWDFRLDISSVITDFEYIPASESNLGMDGFILVGRTEPSNSGGMPQDNESIILRLNDQGATAVIGTLMKRYTLTGREGFSRIVKHPDPVDPDFPYYVVGTKNTLTSPSPPSTAEIVFLVNIDQDGTENFCVEYDYSAVDDEFHRGLFPLENGHLALTGNDSPAGNGVLVKVDGADGSVLNSYTFSAALDIYDGVQLGNGVIVLVGAHFGANEAFAATLNANLQLFQRVRFPDIVDFREIGLDALGRVYTVGEIKANPAANTEGRQAIHRLLIGSASGPIISLDQAMSWYLEDVNQQESDWKDPHIYVNPIYNRIFYADTRLRMNPLAGMGDYDMLVGAYDLDLSSSCRYLFHEITPTFNFNRIDALITAQTPSPPHTFTTGIGETAIGYLCDEFCSQPCTVDFGWQAFPCFNALFSGNGSGVPPLAFEWDFAGLGTSDLVNPVFGFPGPGIYTVCLTVTDDSGCQAEVCHDVEISEDQTLFTLECPPDQTVSTDPGECYALLALEATITDDCPPDPVVTYVLGGATVGTDPFTEYNKGFTTLTATATDGIHTVTCTTEITVKDDEPPVLVCPSPDVVMIPKCEELTPVFFPAPTLSDNCPMASFTCDYQSGDIFPCGTTIVTCTAVDMSGNISECTFPVVVDCTCASITSAILECSPDNPYQYHFVIELLNQSGGGSCGVVVTNNQAGQTTLTLISSGPFDGSGVALVEGTIDVTDPIPSSLELTIAIACFCPSGEFVTCELPVSMPVVCCKGVEVPNLQACESGATMDVPVLPLGTLDNIKRVTWYVKPCSEPSFSAIPYQDAYTTVLEPLHLFPAFHDEDICVYAVVELDDAPCTKLVSNEATIELCGSSDCSVSDQELCYDGTPVKPGLITITPDPEACEVTNVEWYDPAGNLVQTGGLTYEPAETFSPTNPTVDCFEDFFYKIVITDACGPKECQARVRIFSHEAPKGVLDIDPDEDLPLCPGEDVTLHFTPGCLNSLGTWEWFFSTDDLTYTPIDGSGTKNEFWHSNHLDQDTWYLVKTQNGSCPEDTVKILVDIEPTLSASLEATFDDPCSPGAVNLELKFLADPSCQVSIDWYKDGDLIHSTPAPATSPVSFTYTGPGLSGNYYASIQSDCCEQREKTPVVSMPEPCFAVIAGPCFRCEGQTVELTGVVFNLPPGAVCTYQWFTADGNIISGADTEQATVDADGTYIFSATCDGCEKRDTVVFACAPLIVAGTIAMETDMGVEGVEVNVNNGSFIEFTDIDGAYLFDDFAAGGDYTLTPKLDEDVDNGVTTFDMALITRHILGIELLDSPYKIIAADANRSGNVSTLDLVAIRRVILHIDEQFPNNTSWRFVDKDFVFPDPANPFMTVFPEFIIYTDLQMADLEADFVALKVGDVNNSAAPN
ncbi:MAG: HYR domain-containing protein [Saprospirales bacterium]|nr:HYR domain-containing protein [Saprospirales bacterium]